MYISWKKTILRSTVHKNSRDIDKGSILAVPKKDDLEITIFYRGITLIAIAAKFFHART